MLKWQKQKQDRPTDRERERQNIELNVVESTFLRQLENKALPHFVNVTFRQHEILLIQAYLCFLKKMGHSRPLFLYFCLFNTVDSKQVNVRYKSLPMTGFEPLTSGIGNNRSTN